MSLCADQTSLRALYQQVALKFSNSRDHRHGHLSSCTRQVDPAKRAKAIVQAVTNYNDFAMLAEISRDLGEPMVGIEISTIPSAERMQERGW